MLTEKSVAVTLVKMSEAVPVGTEGARGVEDTGDGISCLMLHAEVASPGYELIAADKVNLDVAVVASKE